MKLIVEKPSPLAATEIVACEIVCGADFGCVWHHHPEFEITLVKRGGTERWVGDKLTPLEPGDLVLLGSDLPHDYRNDRGTGRRAQKVEAIVVQFMPHLLGADWHRAHWFADATSRDAALTELSRKHEYSRPGDRPALVFERISR
jgi:mannose-6-phosphate isomerase-like protein (cupin superfamily)